MGEILRAILDATCVDSNPAFYAADIVTVTTNTGARQYQQQQAVIQCKADTWFLMQGWSMDVAFVQAGGNYGWIAKTSPNAFTVQDMKTSKVYSSAGPIPYSDQNYNLNNFVTLPEYILWQPSDLIGIIETVFTGQTAVFTFNSFVTLSGIEYKMPEGKGFSNGR